MTEQSARRRLRLLHILSGPELKRELDLAQRAGEAACLAETAYDPPYPPNSDERAAWIVGYANEGQRQS